MDNILNSSIVLIAEPRTGASSIINYFIKCHGYNFEYSSIPVNKPKTIYLFRHVANFDAIGSNSYNKADQWVEDILLTCKRDNMLTIGLIRNPLSQLFSIYYKTIDNNYCFEEVKINQQTDICRFLYFRNHEGIIHKSTLQCDVVMDIEKMTPLEIGVKLQLPIKLLKLTEISSNRGLSIINNKLVRTEDITKICNSESQKIYDSAKL